MSLDSLRKLRTQTVETLMMELAHITRTLVQNEERHREIEAQIQRDMVSHDQQSSHGLTIEAWLEWQGRMDAQQATLRRLRREIDQAAEAWQQTNARLVEANQECKLLDVVAEKRREAECADRARQEQRTTDEAASRRHSIRREGNV